MKVCFDLGTILQPTFIGCGSKKSNRISGTLPILSSLVSHHMLTFSHFYRRSEILSLALNYKDAGGKRSQS